MIPGLDLHIRPAVAADQKQIASLIYHSPHVHRHLDWRSPLDWVGAAPFLVAEVGGELLASLACPPDPRGICWMRLFAVAPTLPVKETWLVLWQAMCSKLSGLGGVLVPAIILQDWLETLMKGSGFSSHQEIVMLERGQAPCGPVELPSGVTLRGMLPSDLPAVAEVDAAAFDPVWQNSLDTLNRAFPQAIVPTVAVTGGEVVGYQLSTRNPFGAHLARLAVRPGIQRRGVGQALVVDLIGRLERHHVHHLTVNTQSDNGTSLALYRRIGFEETGERYPVYQRSFA